MSKTNFVKCGDVLLIISCVLLSACRSTSASNTPSESEMEVILHATVVSIEDDSMEVVINEDDVKDDMIYTVSIENCEFHIDRDVLTKDYPILIVPAETFDATDTSLEAVKVYGLGN